MKKRNPNLHKKWSSFDDSLLVENLKTQKSTVTEMAKMLGRTRKAVEMRLYVLSKGDRKTVRPAFNSSKPYILGGLRGTATRHFASLEELNEFLAENPNNKQTPMKVLPMRTVTSVIVEE